jgi:pilus assembly protein CpaF
VAVDGTCVSIRRHRAREVPLERFAPAPVVGLLRELVDGRANVLVSGATSTGKTTLLAALARCVDERERLVVIEDTTELDLHDRHAIRLEARAANADGVRPVGLGELVRTALRLRPDRLVVGEFRGDEVLAVVQALNTGHDGSLSTCHANSGVDGLRRLETLVMQAAPSWPLAAIRRQVSACVDAVVHLERRQDGTRRVVEVGEVVATDAEPALRPLATHDRVVGRLERGRR